MVMGDTRIEALDNSLFDKLQVFDGDISPMLEPDNNAIAIAVSLDDYGNLRNPEYYPKVGDTITVTYADDVKYIDSRTGELTEVTPEEYFQEKLYGARDVEYTVCALVNLPNSMSYRYSGFGYDVFCLWTPHRGTAVVQPFRCSTCSTQRTKLTRPKQSNIYRSSLPVSFRP